MTLPVSPNSISMSQVNTELGLTATATVSLNDTAVRSLFGIASGTISLGDGRGKANISPATNLALSSIGQTSATVSWTASISPAVTYYTVYATDAQLATIFTQTFNTLPLPTSAAVTGLTANTPYTVYVVAGSGTASVSANIPLTTTNFDTTPNAFTFTAVTGATVNTQVISEVVTVSGLEPNFNISIGVTGGFYGAGTTSADADAAAFTSTAGTYLTDATGTIYVKAQLTSSILFNTAKTCTVTVGSRSAIFSVTTGAAITTPANFSFTPVTGASLSSVVSSAVTVADGLSPSVSITISVTGGSYGAGTTSSAATSAAFTTTSGTYTTDANGVIYVKARVTASASNYANTSATVTVGGGSAQFTVTTIGDTAPTAFTIPAITDAAVSTDIQSAVVTVTGLSPLYPVPVSISSGGSYDAADSSANLSGTFITTASDVTTDSSGRLYFQAQLTSSASFLTTVTTTITIGSSTAIFSVKTSPDIVPTAFTFTPSTVTSLNSSFWTINSKTLYNHNSGKIWSTVTTVGGLSASSTIPITWDIDTADIKYGTASNTVNNTITSTTKAGNVVTNSSGNTYLQIAVPATQPWTAYSLNVTIGGVTGTLTATTAPLNPDAWTATDLTDVARGTIVYSEVATVTGMTPGFNSWGSGTTGGMYVGIVSGAGKYFASNSSSTTSAANAASYKTAASYIIPDTSGNIYIKLQQTSDNSTTLGVTTRTNYRVGYAAVAPQDYEWSITTVDTASEVTIPFSSPTGTRNTQANGAVYKVTLVGGANFTAASLACLLQASGSSFVSTASTGCMLRWSATSFTSTASLPSFSGIESYSGGARSFYIATDATGSFWLQMKNKFPATSGNADTITVTVRSTPANADGSYTVTAR